MQPAVRVHDPTGKYYDENFNLVAIVEPCLTEDLLGYGDKILKVETHSDTESDMQWMGLPMNCPDVI